MPNWFKGRFEFRTDLLSPCEEGLVWIFFLLQDAQWSHSGHIKASAVQRPQSQAELVVKVHECARFLRVEAMPQVLLTRAHLVLLVLDTWVGLVRKLYLVVDVGKSGGA